jgi:DNA topoisomerase I
MSRVKPADSARGRRRQILDAVREAADELANTPAICRKSYVHETVVTAFEKGVLERFSSMLFPKPVSGTQQRLTGQIRAVQEVRLEPEGTVAGCNK